MKPITEKMIEPETTALATLLGRLDCCFWPSFPIDGRNRTVCHEWRQSWLAGLGIPVRSSNASAAERKTIEERWRTLESSGLVTVTRRKGRRSHVRFTAVGEAFARGLCATGDVFMYWDEFEAFAHLCDEVGEDSLPASFAAGLEPWEPSPEATNALYMQTCHFLPFAVAGYVTFTLDTRGCLWLNLATAGRKAIANPPVEPAEYDDWNLIEEASDVYEAAFTASRQELSVAKPEHPSNLIIPRVPTGWGDFRKYLALRRELNERRASERARATAE